MIAQHSGNFPHRFDLGAHGFCALIIQKQLGPIVEMSLPVPLRAQLADMLMESLDTEETDSVQSLWVREAIRRPDEIRSGKIRSISGDQVLAEGRRLTK
uniref:Addiction module component n=1 Tax=Candidatus Kentrum sp. SD TaxID=2126332 RepID=A0A451BKM1_9GAMM|nr:MAG: Putative addiction module component [Candidatus Kentron sp. SD]VFK43448.1 MAG: Putative addiction module component [Candidatus Kentron sp. SD]VFK78833.1 MAG: Putative addiction module component [Candidatus Kentron sp. SD]